MKANFTCPKCKKHIKVGKQLHCTYTCPNCHHVMVLDSDDVQRGFIPFKNKFKSEFNHTNNFRNKNRYKGI